VICKALAPMILAFSKRVYSKVNLHGAFLMQIIDYITYLIIFS
jgi:hypothetical protein